MSGTDILDSFLQGFGPVGFFRQARRPGGPTEIFAEEQDLPQVEVGPSEVSAARPVWAREQHPVANGR